MSGPETVKRETEGWGWGWWGVSSVRCLPGFNESTRFFWGGDVTRLVEELGGIVCVWRGVGGGVGQAQRNTGIIPRKFAQLQVRICLINPKCLEAAFLPNLLHVQSLKKKKNYTSSTSNAADKLMQ